MYSHSEVSELQNMDLRRLGSSAGDTPVKFQSDRIIWTTNLTASCLCEILRLDVLSTVYWNEALMYFPDLMDITI